MPGALRFASAFVHVPRRATDERLVNFDKAAQLVQRSVLHRKPDSVVDVPSRLLSDAQMPPKFIAANAVLTIRNQPHRGKPLVEAQRGIFEYGSDFKRELGFRMLGIALPDAGLFQIGDFLRATTRAADLTVRPAHHRHELVAVLRLGKVYNRLL